MPLVDPEILLESPQNQFKTCFFTYGFVSKSSKCLPRSVRTTSETDGQTGELRLYPEKDDQKGGWRNGSVVNSACCSCSRSKFSSKYPHSCTQPFVTPVPGESNSLLLASADTRYTSGAHIYMKALIK